MQFNILLSTNTNRRLTRRKATSSWWIGPVPRRGRSQEPFKRLSCFCSGADPIDGRRKVVGQDQYPSMGRFRKPPFLAMGGPGFPWWRNERTSTLETCSIVSVSSWQIELRRVEGLVLRHCRFIESRQAFSWIFCRKFLEAFRFSWLDSNRSSSVPYGF